jgi:hypothetical protein
MGKQARNFMDSWVRKNISAGPYQVDNKEAARLARQCLADAAKTGITKAELEEEIGTVCSITSGL